MTELRSDMEDRFIPRPWARNPHLQTIFASLKIRCLGRNPMVEAAQEIIIDGGDGVRLLGYYSAHAPQNKKALVMLIHGWEGSSDSTYILSIGRYLFGRGYDIFRLNLRDHGNSHHLNEGLFQGALIEEVAHAVRNISYFSQGLPFYVIGFSIGGNFALRIALRQSVQPIHNLRRIISISPPLDPYKATIAIDHSLPIYRHYFLRKWKKSLGEKQRLFPHRYSFDHLMEMKTCMEVTEAIMPYYPEYPSYRHYFNQYTLLGGAFHDLSLPVTIIISADDPIVPIEDVYGLENNPLLDLCMQQHGGHCGFLDPFPFGCWHERKIAALIEADTY